MYEFPVKYYEKNLIFNASHKVCWAAFKMEGFNYDYKSRENKIAILNRLARFIVNIGVEAKILIIPVSQDVDKQVLRLVEDMDRSDILFDKAQAHAKGTGVYLKNKIERKGSNNDYVTYVITKLKCSDQVLKDLKDLAVNFIRRPIQSIEETFSVTTKDILERELEAFERMATDYLKQQNKRVRITPTDALDTQWLYKRMTRRGLGEVALRKQLRHKKGKGFSTKRGEGNYEELPWTPFSERVIRDGEAAIRPHGKDVINLSDGLIDTSENRCIKIVHGDNVESYQAFLPITHIPDGIEFPDNEWLLFLQDLPIQTEVCIHINIVEHKQSIKNIGGKKREIKSQIEHVQESYEEIPDELFDSKETADALEAELRATRAPLTYASITLCLAASNKDELEDKVNFIKEIYEDLNFIIERPISDQLKLFMEFIPGAGRYLNDYILPPLPPRTLAGGMIGATRLLGDNVGPYIGTTGVLEKLVYLFLGRACHLNRSASAAFLGTLGGGKSYNANLLLYLNVLYGGYGLVFDPKGERTKWLRYLPELQDHIEITTLSSSEEDKGKLDPWIIYRDNPEEAGELTINIISELFKLNPKDDEHLVLTEACSWMKKQPKRCMELLANHLAEFPEEDEFSKVAKTLARRVRNIREIGMAGLLFGTGNEKGLDFKNRLNILQIQNLVMPSPETPKEDYTQEETLSTVLMLPIASFAKKFAMSDSAVFKLVLFDESWALSSTAMGIKLFNFLARMGRSLNAGCIFIGHSVTDLKGDGIKNAITYKFCFKTTEIEEIKRVLQFLDLEITDENINEVRNLGNGECLFQDLDGRVGKLKFDVVFEHLDKAFETTPKGKKKEGGENEKTA